MHKKLKIPIVLILFILMAASIISGKNIKAQENNGSVNLVLGSLTDFQ